MKTLIIDKVKDRACIVIDSERYYDLGSINCAFGTIVAVLESEFPIDNYGKPGFIVNHIRNSLADNVKTIEMWEMTVKPTLLNNIYTFFDGREKIDFSLNTQTLLLVV